MPWVNQNSASRHMAYTHLQSCPQQNNENAPERTVGGMCRGLYRPGQTLVRTGSLLSEGNGK